MGVGVGVGAIEVEDGGTDELVVNVLRPVSLSDEHPANNTIGTARAPTTARVSRFTIPPEGAHHPAIGMGAARSR
jgi:hypothetical protein